MQRVLPTTLRGTVGIFAVTHDAPTRAGLFAAIAWAHMAEVAWVREAVTSGVDHGGDYVIFHWTRKGLVILL